MSDFNDSFSGSGMDNQLYNNYSFNANKGNKCLNPATAKTFNINPFQNNFAFNLKNNFNLCGGNRNQNFSMNNINNLNNKNFNNINFIMNNLNNLNNLNNNNFNNINFGMNNINNLNNKNFNNNINFNNNMLLNNFNFNNNQKDITLNFRFMNTLNFKVKAKLGEKLIDVIKRFKNNECPKEFKNDIYAAICQGNKIQDLNKTLLELNIKDEENILIVSKYKKELDKEEEYILNQRENEQLEWLKSKFKKTYLDKGLNNNLKFDSDNINNKIDSEESINIKTPGFSNFLQEIDFKRKGISIREHDHLLVYCLTNIDWTCNRCKKIYSRENMKYYCSYCDYSMCENCNYERQYYMKKSFPKGIKPSHSSVNIHFFQSDLHEHRLVFCRPSKYFIFFKGWKCVNCCETFSNKIWCFYCTLCNYNLCCECCGFH